MFLDMNIWIELVDSRNAFNDSLRGMLIELVEGGRIICPLAECTIWELFKQHVDSALRVAELMDRLSNGVAFSSRRAIQRLEVIRYLNSLIAPSLSPMLNLSDIFAPIVVHFLGGGLVLDVFSNQEVYSGHAATIPWVGAHDALSLLEDCCGGFGRTLCDCVQEQDRYLPVLDETLDFQEVCRRRMEFAGRSWRKHRRAEEVYVMERCVIPLIHEFNNARATSLLLPVEPLLIDLIHLRNKDRYGGVAEDIQISAKAIRAEIDTNTASGRDPNRQTRAGDFYDIEMLIVPRAYSHVMVSRDKWVRSLMCGSLRSQGSLFVDDLAELPGVLKALQAPTDLNCR